MPAEGRMDERGQIVFIELKDLDKAKAVIASLKEGEVIGRGGGELTSSEYNGVTCWNAEGAQDGVDCFSSRLRTDAKNHRQRHGRLSRNCRCRRLARVAPSQPTEQAVIGIEADVISRVVD